jgi:hypothetical protein
MRDQRKRVWIDQFQTRLATRIAAYLGLFLVVLVNFLFAWRLVVEGVTNPAVQFLNMLYDYLPVGVCLCLLVPVMAWDAIRWSHRLIGPLVRFRYGFKSVANNEPMRPLKLREGDYLTELRDDFNEMLEALQSRGALPPPPEPQARSQAPIAGDR